MWLISFSIRAATIFIIIRWMNYPCYRKKLKLPPLKGKDLKDYAATDSIRSIVKEVIPIQDVIDNTIINNGDTVSLGPSLIDINKYVFEVEKINSYNAKLDPKKLEVAIDTTQKKTAKSQVICACFLSEQPGFANRF